MRRISLEKIQSGEKTADGVYTGGDNLLVGAGYRLSGKNLDRLDELGVLWVYMDDPRTQGMQPSATISEDLKRTTRHRVHQVFHAITEAHANQTIDDPETHMDAVCPKGITSEWLSELEAASKSLLENIFLGSSKCFVVTPQEEREGYFSHHAIEVLAGCVMMARKMLYDSKEIAAIAQGGLMHNVGMFFLPTALVEREGALSAAEDALMRHHPHLGYEFLRKNPRVGILAAHMAYQHHESQDGSGYPRALKGSNRIPKRREPIATKAQIHRYAEICAIVDTFVALTSHRPYRKAMTVDRALDVIMRLAGNRLNLEMVKVFISITPRYPAGSEIQILSGEYAGHTGVVWELSTLEINRPLIKVLDTPDGDALADDVFINLIEQPFIQIQCI